MNLKISVYGHSIVSLSSLECTLELFTHRKTSWNVAGNKRLFQGPIASLSTNLLTVFCSRNEAAWRSLEDCFPDMESLAS